MDREFDQLLARLRALEDEIKRKVVAGRTQLNYRLDHGRVEFAAGVLAQHRRLRTGLARYLRDSRLGFMATAPFVYALVLPLLLLDAAVVLYQAVCFRAWGLAPVSRGDYVVIDRHHLAYRNGVENLNCAYCGYANGVLALAREVASRTEQYWCPAKHARAVKGAHSRYRGFADYGDAAGYRRRIAVPRAELDRAASPGPGAGPP